MEALQILLVVATLAILSEVTYLVVKLPRQNLSRKQSRPILVDTSVLIDGRIIAVAQSGFIGDTLVIPRSVIGELQFLADNADHDKRARARYGLDVVKELQAMAHLKVEILQDGSKAEEGVDERLLSLAKKHNAAVCTIDYNLNKVAVVEGIAVLNVNELAQSLRMAYLPGEKMLLELVQKGQDSHQGVGYLTDGTMVVVEHANKNIGQTIEIEFIRSLQTAAGKMMFAKPVERPQQVTKVQKPTGKRPVAQSKPAAPAEATERQQPAKTTNSYHSDAKERRYEKKDTQKPQQPRVNNDRPRQTRSSKPRTSVQREAALIDLVEKQE
ncbi:MAG: PIN domain-containing protein [Candidatus Saccharimonadales bacterium]